MRRIYKSSFAEHIKKFITLRKASGIVIKNTECTMAKFDKFLSKKFPKAKIITRSMFMDFMDSVKYLKPVTLNKHATDIRQLCFYLFQDQPKIYIPETRLFPRPIRYITPFIFTEKDIAHLMLLAGKLGPKGRLRPHLLQTLLGLLWSTGIRVGEALSLEIEDFDVAKKILHIKKTKYFKSRYVPLSVSTSEQIFHYLKLRNKFVEIADKKAPFFINHKGQRLSYDTFRSAHWVLIRRSGIKNKQGRYPRIVDFRHSFATLCLERLQREKKDPNVFLPILATYLGHSCVSMTQTYLHPSQDILSYSGTKFNRYFNDSQINQTGEAHHE